MSTFNDTIEQINPKIILEAKSLDETIALFKNPKFVYMAGYENEYEADSILGIGSTFEGAYAMIEQFKAEGDKYDIDNDFCIDLYLLDVMQKGFDTFYHRIQKADLLPIYRRLTTHKGFSEDEISKIPEL